MTETFKSIRATREIVVNIHGEEYDALLIPRKSLVEIDFSDYPEGAPLRRGRVMERATEIDLELGEDLVQPVEGVHRFRLTEAGVRRLLGTP